MSAEELSASQLVSADATYSALRLVRKAIVSSAAGDHPNSDGKRRPLFESAELLLTVSLFDLPPKDSSASVLLTLPHPVHCPSRDTGCLITKDLPRAPEDYEATSGHYADLLRSAGCQEGLTILPLRELTVAYMPFEAKRRLCHAYDYFLADRRICHRLGNKLGAYFLNKNRRKLPIPVNLEARSLAEEIETARRTVRICLTGSTVSCLVGRVEEYGSVQEDKELLENIASASEQIFKRLPSVSAIYLRHPSCGNVPLYVASAPKTTADPVSVKTLVKKAPRKAKIDLDKDLAELGETLWDKGLVSLPIKQRKEKPGKKAITKRNSIGKISKGATKTADRKVPARAPGNKKRRKRAGKKAAN